jgi:hypothetical protein
MDILMLVLAMPITWVLVALGVAGVMLAMSGPGPKARPGRRMSKDL